MGAGGPWSIKSIKEYQFFPKIFFVASLCSFICLQAVYQVSGAVCKATWNGYPSYSLLTFISSFLIDFLSIRKVIIFSAININIYIFLILFFYALYWTLFELMYISEVELNSHQGICDLKSVRVHFAPEVKGGVFLLKIHRNSI